MDQDNVALVGLKTPDHIVLSYFKKTLASIVASEYSILTKAASQIPGKVNKIQAKNLLEAFPKLQDTKYLWLCNLNENIEGFEKLLENDDGLEILVENPYLTNSWTLQRLMHLNVFQKKILWGLYKRHQQEFRTLRESIQKAIEGNNKIACVFIESVAHEKTIFEEKFQDFDLLFFLTQLEISTIHQSGNPESNLLTAGTLNNGATFMISERKSDKGEQSTHVRVVFDTEECLSADISSNEPIHQMYHKGFKKLCEVFIGLEKPGPEIATIKDVSRIIRAIECARESGEKGSVITLKHLSQATIECKTAGTAIITEEAFFDQLKKIPDMVVTGMYSPKADRLEKMVRKHVAAGEPIYYAETFAQLVTLTSKDKVLVYIPDLPGDRKDNEMIEALNGGCYVLAEKPAFANAEEGRKLLDKLDESAKKRLIFGWHYIHHPTIRNVLDQIRQGEFGKLKHVNINSTFPKEYIPGQHERFYEPKQGGVGLDLFSYHLHLCFWLMGFEGKPKLLQDKVRSAQYMDEKNKELGSVDSGIYVAFDLGGKFIAECSAIFDAGLSPRCEVTFTFENETQILIREYTHNHYIHQYGILPVLIKKKGEYWRPFYKDDIYKNEAFRTSSFYHQLIFMKNLMKGNLKYDTQKDRDGLLIENNIKLQEMLDEVLVKGGIPVHKGMTGLA